MTAAKPTGSLVAAASELYRMTGRGLTEHDERTLSEMLAVDAGKRWLSPRYDLAGETRHLLAARALVGLFLLDENVMWSVWRPDARRGVLQHLRDLIDGCDELRSRVRRFRVANGEERIEMVKDHWLVVAARWNHGGRGFTTDCHIAEDVRGGHDDLVEASYSLVGRANPQFVVSYRIEEPA